MKTARYVASFLLCIVLSIQAFASMSDLDKPVLGFPKTFPVAAREKVNDALQPVDCKFVAGTSHTAGTVLRYEGETVPLNFLLERLAACPGMTLSIRFNNPENATYDWTVEQSAFHPERVCVRINLKSPRITAEDLVVPDRAGPRLVQTK